MPDEQMLAAMSEAGISPDSLDADSDLETVTESTDAEGEVKEEVVDSHSEEQTEEIVSEGEETETPVEESKEVQTEEPKLTAKEFQELEVAKSQIENERKAFMEEKAQFEKEVQEKYLAKVQDFDQFDAFLGELAETDADLFGLIKDAFSAHQKQYNNPINQKISQEIAELKKELSAYKAKASDEVVMTKLNSEMNEAKATLGKEAEAAGLKVDWTKIEDAWAENPKLDIKKAFYAEYGEQLLKASVSKAKVSQVVNKVANTPKVSTAGTVKRSNTPAEKDFSKMDARDVVGYFARQLTGKA